MTRDNRHSFREDFDVCELECPAAGNIISVMQDLQSAMIYRPQGKWYSKEASRVDSVEKELRRMGHGRAAIFWALDYLISWNCLSYQVLRCSLGRPAPDLPESLLAEIENVKDSPATDLEFVFRLIVPEPSLKQWPACAQKNLLNIDTSFSTEPEDSKEHWVKSAGWSFGPGQFAYYGRVFDLSGMQLKLLKALAGRKRRWTIAELKSDVWEGREVEDGSIRGDISRLRTLLRELLKIPDDFDPISQKGSQYSLDLKNCV